MSENFLMKQELQERLFKDYPKIFARRHMSKEHTLMCYGIQCPDSWYDIIDTLCARIKSYADQNGLIIEANQIKTKFGGLRFYVTYSDPYVRGLIDMAEMTSLKIKE
jgi:hypothetical protein